MLKGINQNIQNVESGQAGAVQALQTAVAETVTKAQQNPAVFVGIILESVNKLSANKEQEFLAGFNLMDSTCGSCSIAEYRAIQALRQNLNDQFQLNPAAAQSVQDFAAVVQAVEQQHALTHQPQITDLNPAEIAAYARALKDSRPGFRLRAPGGLLPYIQPDQSRPGIMP